MHRHDEVCNGLQRALNLWNAMANNGFSGEFKRTNEPISQYWKDIKVALNLLLPLEETLKEGFWPKVRCTL